ncbi:hypothetical protein LMJ53_12280 [Rheinheimera sp. UJ51]|uniref:hypothetical protein n=1 Tax=unclassified Rheinheimera TaxID=115860 RepID=UPI001E2B6874|nr:MULTISPECIES: hypothetical protein [unclassified Rheinheimera]MCC5452497.1 hypothetical protein [Rheinheimera sp. UJ51]MCF4010316.1 hypothetical protein [Rheinheimera sp. UJ63]
MDERNCLQKIRNLGARLHELELTQPLPGKSYTSAALDFLFQQHQLERPSGAGLETILQTLGQAVMAKHHLTFSHLDANSVIDYFCRYYRVH